MEYKTVSKIEGIYSYPYEEFGIKIDISSVKRELLEEEVHMICRQAEEILKILRKNTLLLDPSEIDARIEEKNYLLACFPSHIYVREIPNEYSDSVNPWFEVITLKGKIKIGWRKRVINIDWSQSDIHYDASDLFKDEETTKYDQTIHAWGYEKAKEYITKLLQ